MGFIYVGRLDEIKGIKILLQAWKELGDDAPTLKVCGIGPMEEWCKNYIAQNNLTTVVMLGFVHNTEVKKLIASSEALILPTQWYEGFPMTILEAYSVGTPVIGSDLGNTGSIIEEGVTGYKFKMGSVKSLTSVIRNYSYDSIDRENVKKQYKLLYSENTNYALLKYIYDVTL